MANLLKKIEVGNPLYNLELFELLEKYEEAQTDEELAKVYHEILHSVEGRKVAESMTHAMIAYSVGTTNNQIYMYMNELIENHNTIINMKMEVKLAKGKWTVNGKQLSEMNLYETKFMDEFFKEMKIKN